MVNQAKEKSKLPSSSGTSISTRNQGMKIPCNRQKCFKSAKVKFLSVDEAIKLGTQTATRVTYSTRCPKSKPSGSLYAIPKRTSPAAKVATSKSQLVTNDKICSSSPLWQQEICWSSGEKYHNGSTSNEYTSVGLTKIVQVEDRFARSVALGINPKPSSSMIMPQKDMKSCSSELPSELKEIKPKRRDDSRHKQDTELVLNRVKGPSSVTKENNSLSIRSYSQKYPPNVPTLEIIWKSSFEVLNGPHVGFHEGFLAHPSANISCRAYNFSKQIAGVLQFKLYPRHENWPKIFQTDTANGNGIDLYFYPKNFEWSKKKYSSLLKFMEKNDLVLKSHMGHVELLVFPSKLLSEDSQKLDGSYFMWGVFCNLKGSLTI